MIFDYLRTSYAFVIPPILGFFVLIFLSLISFLRGPRRPTNILFAVICFMGSLINADVALVSIIPDKTFQSVKGIEKQFDIYGILGRK